MQLGEDNKISEQGEFASVVRRLAAGDEAACEKLIRDYLPHMKTLARRELNQTRLRNWLDSNDICQDALSNLFCRIRSGALRLDEPRDVSQMLMGLVCDAVSRQMRRERAARRNLRRLGDRPPEDFELAAADGDPADEAATCELTAMFLARLSEEETLVLNARRDGASWAQVVELLGGEPDARRVAQARCLARVFASLGLELPQRPPGKRKKPK